VAALKRRHRRRGGGGPDGTAGASRAVDLSHQTLAKPETRRGSAETGGCCAAAWRSGARRLNRAAGQEPKGASALLFFVIRVLVMVVFVVFSGKLLIGFQSRHATPRHATPRHATPRRSFSVTTCPQQRPTGYLLFCLRAVGPEPQAQGHPPAARRGDRVFTRGQTVPLADKAGQPSRRQSLRAWCY